MSEGSSSTSTEAAKPLMSRWMYLYWGAVGVTAVLWAVNRFGGGGEQDPMKVDRMTKVLKSKGVVVEKKKEYDDDSKENKKSKWD